MADVEVVQDGVTVARASAVFLLATATPPGEVWSRPERLVGPGDEVRAAADGLVAPWFGSGDDGPGWTPSMADHQGAARKRMWTRMPHVLADEVPTPVHPGGHDRRDHEHDDQLGECRRRLHQRGRDLALARLPEGEDIGVEADHHISADGIAVGSATLYDRNGPIGSCTVTAWPTHSARSTSRSPGRSATEPACRAGPGTPVRKIELGSGSGQDLGLLRLELGSG